MDLDTLSKIGEFLGGTVVVISLLYLARQAKHSAQQQRSENYGRTVDRAAAAMSHWASNPDLNRLVIDGSVGMENLDPYDRMRFIWQMNEIFGVYEFTFEQHNLNLLPRHVWGRYSQHLGFWISLPGVREYWKRGHGDFSPNFMKHVEGRMNGQALTVEEAKEVFGV